MEDDSTSSPPSHEYDSAYEQAVGDELWLSELSEEWISNPGSTEASEQGSARGMNSIRVPNMHKIDSIPEEVEPSETTIENGTVRVVLKESDVNNTPEWKQRFVERMTPKDLFSPCHLENLFMEDSGTRYDLICL